MPDLEKQLNSLPKASLSKRADFLIRVRLYKMIWSKYFTSVVNLFIRNKLYPIAILSVFILAVLIIPGYAYTNPYVTRESLLYPLKQKIEDIEVGLAADPTAQAVVYTKLAARRLAEAEIISQKHPDKVATSSEVSVVLRDTIIAAERLSDKADTAVKLITDGKAQEKTESHIDQARSEQVSTLTRIAQTVGIDAEENTVDTVALAIERLQTNSHSNTGNTKNENNRILPYSENSGATPTPADMTVNNNIKESPSETETPNVSPAETATETAATGTEKRPFRNEAGQSSKRQADESLQGIITKFENLKGDLATTSYDQKDVTNLFGRLKEKIEKAKDKIKSDDLSDIDGILKSADALTNNAKSFIKKQNGRNTIKTDKSEDNNSPQLKSDDLKNKTKTNFKSEDDVKNKETKRQNNN